VRQPPSPATRRVLCASAPGSARAAAQRTTLVQLRAHGGLVAQRQRVEHPPPPLQPVPRVRSPMVLLFGNACAKFQRKQPLARAVSSASRPLSRHDLALRLAEPPPEPRPAVAEVSSRGELVSSFLSLHGSLSHRSLAMAGVRLSRPGRPRPSPSRRPVGRAPLASHRLAGHPLRSVRPSRPAAPHALVWRAGAAFA
jgi:hypothetical protein